MKTKIWCAVCTYVLIAIVKKELQLDVSLYTLLQILSVSAFEKTQLSWVLQVLAAMEKSDALRRQQHQVVHPLDTRIAPQKDAELGAFDAATERTHLVMPLESDDPLSV